MLDGNTFDDALVIPSLSRAAGHSASNVGETYYSAPEVDLGDYDHIIVCLSGGKDSLACHVRLIEMGADMSRVEWWHHDVDGNEGSNLMDWSFMRDYNRKLAATFDVPLYFSWLEGGFEGELNKENAFSRPHKIETPEGLITLERDHGRSKPGTRLRFPQQAASLQTRWCSSSLKIDVGRRQLNNQDRFKGKRVLFITGERREESGNRAKYNQFEPHACDRRGGRTGRRVDAWRPVLHWSEEEVWAALERHRIVAPVPYRLGWSRSSCMNCVFNSPRIWATIDRYFPERARKISSYEDRFRTTISRNRINVIDLGASVASLDITDEEALLQAAQEEYRLPVLVPEGQRWKLPAGAFGGEACGSV